MEEIFFLRIFKGLVSDANHQYHRNSLALTKGYQIFLGTNVC
jgi:hypothetical protein